MEGQGGTDEGDGVLPAPEVLAEAYEAVRDGRIHDPTTIREIAQAFARVAKHPPTEAEFPYDAATAARILWDFANKLDQQLALATAVPAAGQ